MSTQLTVRNVPADIDRRLKALARAQDDSVNNIVIRLLGHALGISNRREQLKRFQTWTEDEVRAMDEVLKETRQVDEDLWK